MPEDTPPLVAFADTLAAVMSAVGSLLAVGLGTVATGAGVLAGLSGDTAPGLALFVFGLTFLLLGVAASADGRSRLARRRDPTVFGRGPTVEAHVRRPRESDTERCTRCETPSDRGLLRRYREETLLAGVPFYTHDTGETVYCLDCATTAFVGPAGAESFDLTEPAPDALDALAGDDTDVTGVSDPDREVTARDTER